ncbi:periplasmic substrate-binding protein/sensor histidine kinase [Marinomonas sp. MED121]|uniref:transporter substrate-binding domain-containing protein n=1 Tax=Marinomonas sp. MED121 TaxID=314277 RepID=UPI0000690C19|nr:transporter substrate-binding domain-containing protein [Marinomonas sp. MED121]EAQ64912.1 periplasmic substrate-binding protein/sensor histidine kinase [Marinomonas sp. MED121]
MLTLLPKSTLIRTKNLLNKALQKVYFLVFLSLFSSTAFANQDIIRIGGDLDYPPYEFLNSQGEPDGYNTELTLAIAEVMGMKVEFVFDSWSSVRQQLDRQEIDILQGMVYSDMRAKTLSFSPSHALITQSIFTRQGLPLISNLNLFNGQDLVVQDQGIMHDYLVENKVNANLVLVETHADALRLVASGANDYALVANLPGLYLGKELALSNLRSITQPYGTQRYGYAALQKNENLIAKFSEGMAILKNTGRQQEIYDKWLGPLSNQGPDWKLIGQFTLIVSSLLLLFLGGSLIWNRMLSREVSKRTQRVELQQQQLIQADKMASLGVLVSGVAHEINNPCSLMLLNLPTIQEVHRDLEEILEDYYQSQGEFYLAGIEYSIIRDELPKMLNDMMSGSQRISRIVNDLRDFGRQENIELTEHVDINQLVSTSYRLIEQTVRNYSDNISIQYEDNLPSFLGSAQRIEQVIINLILNAAQSLTSKDKSIEIRTFMDSTKGQLVLEIKDQGCGIAIENLKRLEDPFFTTKRDQGGTGLGLSISSNIVSEHGGKLSFKSELNKGTKVSLTLPIFNQKAHA